LTLPDESREHTPLKGCLIYDIWKSYNRNLKLCTKRKCKTHNVIIGRGNWEIGWYDGIPSIPDPVQHAKLKAAAQAGRRARNN
jgi:hypothetical protein